MSTAPNYTPVVSFADDESNQAAGRATIRTTALDVELADISSSVNGLNTNLQRLQRDDGKLLDLLVEPYALAEQTRAMMAVGGKVPRGAWTPNTLYYVGNLVQRNAVAFMCATEHNSGSAFNLGFWITISGDGSAAVSAQAAQASQTAASANQVAAQAAATAAFAQAAAVFTSATSAIAAALAAQNSADSIAGLSPVNLSAYMLALLANNSPSGARASLGAAAAADFASVTDVAEGASMVGFGTGLAYPAGTVGWAINGLEVESRWFRLAGAVDETAEIQAALDFVAMLRTKGGGTVRLSRGINTISDTLRISGNCGLLGYGPTGATTEDITTLTGSVLRCNFGTNKLRWAISSATYVTAGGAFAAYNANYSGVAHDFGEISLCMGIRIQGISIDGAGIYGGLRLIGASNFDVQNVYVNNTAVGYLFNTSYGGRYGRLYTKNSIYGVAILQCNGIECGELYSDRTYSNWAVDGTTRLVSTFDLGPGAFMPDWSNKRIGIYVQNSINIDMRAHKSEHTDVGAVFVHAGALLFNGYFEACADSDMGFVSTTGVVTAFANATVSGKKYHFGVNNSLRMEACTNGGIYVGHPQNSVVISQVDQSDGATDWEWNDAITFEGLTAFRASTAGAVSAAFGYTTFGEALRRIAGGKTGVDTILIKDGDTVSTDAQVTLDGASLTVRSESGGTRPTINFAAAGGGFIYRMSCRGNCSINFSMVNFAFPSTAAAPTDNSLFVIPANSAALIELSFRNGNIAFGNGYGLAHVSAGGALNWRSSFADCGITATTPAGLITTETGGAAVVTNIAASTALQANIKAIGTNGWQATVLASNFQ